MKFFSKKPKAMDISEGCIAWFQSHLSERIFFIINLENQLSDYGRILSGAPQGSTLGPLLFPINQDRISPRNNYARLKVSFRKTSMGQKVSHKLAPQFGTYYQVQ